jgi:hypothetical protein
LTYHVTQREQTGEPSCSCRIAAPAFGRQQALVVNSGGQNLTLPLAMKVGTY